MVDVHAHKAKNMKKKTLLQFSLVNILSTFYEVFTQTYLLANFLD